MTTTAPPLATVHYEEAGRELKKQYEFAQGKEQEKAEEWGQS